MIPFLIKDVAVSEVQIKDKQMINPKKILFSLIILVIFTLAVIFISKIIMDIRYLNDEEVKEIVFRTSASSPDDVSEYKCAKEISEDGKLVYKISFLDSKGVYQFLLDCETGKIIEFEELLNTNSVSKTDEP